MKIILFCLTVLLTGSLRTSEVRAAEIIAVKNGHRIDITIDGKHFTSYCFSGDGKYPFFYPLNGPLSGGSVTSLRNAVYPHHTSLFLGCDMVNGGNYWQEGPDLGRILSLNACIAGQGGDTAVITDECIWIRPGAFSPVRDMRKYTITAPSSAMIQIDFDITLEMLTDVTIQKTNHSLFSARMASDLSVANGGTMINARGDTGEKETFGIPSPWIDYHGKRGNFTEGLTIMQHPSNPWYPSPWFTRDYGFMSPTPMYWPENGEETFLEKGTKLRLRYRVIIHSGNHREAGIAGEFEKYKILK